MAITTLCDPFAPTGCTPLETTMRAEIVADERGRLCLSIDGGVLVE